MHFLLVLVFSASKTPQFDAQLSNTVQAVPYTPKSSPFNNNREGERERERVAICRSLPPNFSFSLLKGDLLSPATEICSIQQQRFHLCSTLKKSSPLLRRVERGSQQSEKLLQTSKSKISLISTPFLFRPHAFLSTQSFLSTQQHPSSSPLFPLLHNERESERERERQRERGRERERERERGEPQWGTLTLIRCRERLYSEAKTKGETGGEFCKLSSHALRTHASILLHTH